MNNPNPTSLDEARAQGVQHTASSPVPEAQEGRDDIDVSGADFVPEPDRSVEDRLLDEPSGPITLSTGLEVEIRPLKLREFLKLLKVITRGGASIMGNVNLDFNDTDAFVQELLAIILFAVPEAEDEVVEFLEAIVKPTGLVGDIQKDSDKMTLLVNTFDNPEIEDVIDVITLLVRTEGRDLQALGKRLRAMFQVGQKMGATKGLNATL
jgi:hypothetical protein